MSTIKILTPKNITYPAKAVSDQSYDYIQCTPEEAEGFAIVRYVPEVDEELYINGSKTLMTLARRFENNSGSSVTIKEVGIQSVNGLLVRFVPSTPITIANGESQVISIVFESET